jgi:hypothetical protein
MIASAYLLLGVAKIIGDIRPTEIHGVTEFVHSGNSRDIT